MKTNYFEIESIIAQGTDVTIAANITLEGILYSEPVYTNIFCSRDQLTDWMQKDGSPVAQEMLAFFKDGEERVQADLEDYNENRRWKPHGRVWLEPVPSPDSAFACYNLVAFEST